VSAARTVLVAAHAAADGSMFAPTVAVTVADAETDAASARDAFVSIQPPDAASDRVRAALLTDVQRAVDIIELVRIAARRSEIGDLERVAMPLQDLAARLDRFATRYG
jgi:predicted dienelactone hydrolase